MSQQRLGPYINVQGRAREAMEFYQDVLGGKLDVQTANDRVAQARLDADGVLIVASDGHLGINWMVSIDKASPGLPPGLGTE